mgnify:CR=1 FL=1
MNKKKNSLMRETRVGIAFLLPALIPLMVFWMLPVLLTVGLSFTKWDMISPEIKWVGIKNYVTLFKSANFFKIIKNTFVFSVGATIPNILMGLILALVLVNSRRGAGFYRTMMFVPYITPMVAASIIWSWLYDPSSGFFNYVRSLFGLSPLKWTGSRDTAMLSVIIVTVWKSMGYTMVFYLEGIKKVPESLHDAATVDGANGFQKFWYVTMPMIAPTTFFLLIINTISTMQAYDQIQVLTSGGPAGATRTILYYYYTEAFGSFNTGKASAVAMVLVFITVILSVIESAASKTSIAENKNA